MKHVPMIKAFTLILVFCISDTYVLADARKPSVSDKNAATNIAPSKLLLGRLYVSQHQGVLVNGHDAMSGDSIFSGSRLQTSFLSATVEIASAGELDIAPDTDLLLKFNQTSVEVKVAAGNATLSTSDGVKGEVITPDGKGYSSRPKAYSEVRGNALMGWDDALIALGIGTVGAIIGHYIYDHWNGGDCKPTNTTVTPITVNIICKGNKNNISVNITQ